MSIIIIPSGDISNKILSIIGAIELSKRTNKKVTIWNSNYYDDVFFETNDEFYDCLPKLNNKNIEMKTFDIDVNKEYPLHLKRLLKYQNIKAYSEKYANDNKLKIHSFGIIPNKYPEIDSGIITNTWIRGYNNSSLSEVKNWLKDVTKYRCYESFNKYVGFDWINPNRNLVVVDIPISIFFELIFFQMSPHYILSPEYYEEAAKILSKKSSKPLDFLIISDIYDVHIKDYINVLKKYGNIIYHYDFIPRSYQLIICSRATYIIGSIKHTFSTLMPTIFQDNIDLAICPKFEIINPVNYPKNIMIINDYKYKIDNPRDLEKLSIQINFGFRRDRDLHKKILLKLQFDNIKPLIDKNYSQYYSEFDKHIKSKYFRNLLLYKIVFIREKARYIHSNISISEGLEIFKLIKNYKPKKLIEIGFATGISACYMLCAMTPGDKLYSIDPFQKILWDRFGLINVKEVEKELDLPKNTSHWIPEFSGNYFKKTNDKYDFMLIDGDHSFEGTMIDLEGSLKILNKGGILAIDDVLHKNVKDALFQFMKSHNDKFEMIKTEVKSMNFYIKKK